MSEAKDINFMGGRKIAAFLSIALIVISLGSLIFQGLKLGLDFTGGTLIEVAYESSADVNSIREDLVAAGYKDVAVQHFGSEEDVLVRMQEAYRADLGDEVLSTLRANTDEDIQLRRSEFVGSQVGEELRDDGGIAMLLALAVVMIYVAARFQFKFSVGAVAALMHDVIIVLGIFSLLQIDFDLNVLAALLAVIGYSLNDTIVVSDRIRENFRIIRQMQAIDIVNRSLTNTLGRTLVTSLTTLLVLLALLFVGGESIHNFALALTIGVVVGTYSSIYVASNILLAMNITRDDLLPPEEEEDPELAERP
ncbi:protein translocase subunit SecF [Bermanella marisrubri]|uniref:Protein-export membrane protein SecF n=1 Tax=Bermanella marisrubri TaxID=207949 RepID=Q1MY59_9GAMM|nr:protein translocase subunit SecF [Bermanella marisrubri]EAT10901.1 protein-export membrane protein SecF [Oceanobacter sp. RED65] [Bermanella marisrubri]QIZ85332.1 protein translocase subunit SecF [Bermanella marisrubri]